MQKKKPTFQAIPNYSINGVTNWNESKEVPAEQGLRGYWPAQALRLRQAFSARMIAIAKLSRRPRAGAELYNPHAKMVQRNSAVRAILAWIGQPCSLNIQAKYETLCAGRPFPGPELS